MEKVIREARKPKTARRRLRSAADIKTEDIVGYMRDWSRTLEESYAEADGSVKDSDVKREIAHIDEGARRLAALKKMGDGELAMNAKFNEELDQR